MKLALGLLILFYFCAAACTAGTVFLTHGLLGALTVCSGAFALAAWVSLLAWLKG